MDDNKLNKELATVLADVEADASRYETHEERASIAEYQVMVLVAGYKRALAALKAAPKPPWNFRPTIGWQGVYCDWYEAQVALGQTEV